MDTLNQNPEILLILIIFALVMMVMIVISILQIPKIVKYEKANVKLLALIAKKQGASIETIQQIVNDADAHILSDDNFEKQLLKP